MTTLDAYGPRTRTLLARLLRRRREGNAPALPELVPGPGRLVLAAVCLDPVLEEVTAVAEPATVVAIVGENGAGRSVLLSLAAGLLQPERGRVCLDGQDLAHHSQASVSRAIALLRSDGGPPRDGPSVLLLDEDEGFDPGDVDRLVTGRRGRTTLLVATHRRKLVEVADSVWHLEDGRIAESGPPSALLGADTRTARLFGHT